MKYAKRNKRQWNGKQHKPIFGSSSKVLCPEQVCIMFINMFINLHYYLIFKFKSYWIHYFHMAHRLSFIFQGHSTYNTRFIVQQGANISAESIYVHYTDSTK